MVYEAEELTPSVKAVLHEIAAALAKLEATGETHTIFINKMALQQTERQAVRDFLGEGTVSIRLADNKEPAAWQESGFAGIWYGVFYDYHDQPLVETIEIAVYPEIAAAQALDRQESLQKLQALIME